MDIKDIQNRFTYHPPQGDQAGRYGRIREWALNFAFEINELTPQCREQSLAITALEECVSWANAAIARNESQAAKHPADLYKSQAEFEAARAGGAPMRQQQPGRVHVFKPGDSLYLIAHRYHMTLEELYEANKDQWPTPSPRHNGEELVGLELRIPDQDRDATPTGDKINGVPVSILKKIDEDMREEVKAMRLGDLQHEINETLGTRSPNEIQAAATTMGQQVNFTHTLESPASEKPEITGDTSDGYHTFNELYEHRHALFTCLMNAYPDISWRSARAHDGSVMEGWFLAGMHLPTGDVSYHLPDRWTGNTYNITELERAPEFDGHTSLNVIERLMLFAYDTARRNHAS